jgi:serine protease Do
MDEMRKTFLYIFFLAMIIWPFARPMDAYPSETGQCNDLTTAIARVARETIPAVVHIDVVQSKEVVAPAFPFEDDPFFQYFFNAPGIRRKVKKEFRGLGTGVIMDGEGHILTNHHLVAGADEMTILLADGTSHKAEPVGVEPKTDLAVIKIKATGSLPHVIFGDSDAVEVGHWVVAIGHPRGLDQTVTQGIISAKHRRGILDPSSYQDFLQTDAAINPGNSGGPLLNLKGEVIGINAAIVSQSGGYEGIGFAIPSNMALRIARELIAKGKVEHGWLGISVQDITPELARYFRLKSGKGALIADVAGGGPGDRAGLKRGDVAVRFKGREIADAITLLNEAAVTPVGTEAKIVIVRGGEEKELSIKVEKREEGLKGYLSILRERLGVEVRNLSEDEIARNKLGPSGGVAITWLEPDGPMQKSGFEANDLLLQVDGRRIGGVKDLAEKVMALGQEQRITFLAVDHRSGRAGYVQVKSR